MKFTTYLTIIFLLMVSLSFTCNKTNCPPTDNAVAAHLHDYTGLDGCSWVITLENDEVLEPMNLNDFDIELKEGKKIWIKYTNAENQASICMVGPIIKIKEIWDR